MIETRFTRLVGASAPIQVASMPGVSTPALVAAVANAGAVGMLGASGMPAPLLEADLEQIAKSTPGVFGANFLMPFLDRACVAVAARRARIVEFFYGEPEGALVDEVHACGALASWQVGSLDEALAAERAGCDFVIAQGTEAGGHVRGQTSVLPLLARVLDALEIPVLAAGGIATARDLAAVIAAGASGARLGTRFVACAESGAHPDYVRALLIATADDTCLTEVFSEQWPNAPHRVLRSAIAAAQAATDPIVARIETGVGALPVPRFSPLVPSTATSGNIAAMALYAGESVTQVTTVEPAAAIVAELVAGAQRRLLEISRSEE
jgi:NAD(P)H-dependent flavin oxidoreductase YrpB (nitropropane dioxygenase family)